MFGAIPALAPELSVAFVAPVAIEDGLAERVAARPPGAGP